MMDLSEFLLARIAEDEAVARAAYDHDDWTAEVDGNGDTWVTACDRAGQHWRIAMASSNPADHIARHDPARVLAECEAKRQVVARASRSVVTATGRRPSPFGNLSFSEGRYYGEDGRDVTDEFAAWHAVDGEPKDPDTLRILAAVYADHPDFRDEWRPV